MALAASLALQGCATLSKEECERGDWQAVGYQDGAHGYRESRFDDHLQSCREYRITPDLGSYRQGRQRGLEEIYCQPGSGYKQGLSGSGNTDVCPSDMAGDFLAAYRYGEEIHGLQQQLDELGSDISKRDGHIEDIEKDIHKIRQQLRKDSTLTEEKRRQLQRELRLLDRERLDELELRKRLHHNYVQLKDHIWQRKLHSPYQ